MAKTMTCSSCGFSTTHLERWNNHRFTPRHREAVRTAEEVTVMLQAQQIRIGDYRVNGHLLHNTHANPLELRGARPRSTQNAEAFMRTRMTDIAAPILAARMQQAGLNQPPPAIDLNIQIQAQPQPQPTIEVLVRESIAEAKKIKAEESEKKKKSDQEKEKIRQKKRQERQAIKDKRVEQRKRSKYLKEYFANLPPLCSYLDIEDVPLPKKGCLKKMQRITHQKRVFARGMKVHQKRWWKRYNMRPESAKLYSTVAMGTYHRTAALLSPAQVFKLYEQGVKSGEVLPYEQESVQEPIIIGAKPKPDPLPTLLVPKVNIIAAQVRNENDDDYERSCYDSAEAEEERMKAVRIGKQKAFEDRRKNRRTPQQIAEDIINAHLNTKPYIKDVRLIGGFWDFHHFKMEELNNYMRLATPAARAREIIKRWRSLTKSFKMMWRTDPDRAAKYDQHGYTHHSTWN